MQGIIILRYKTTKLCIVQHLNIWNIIFINNISSLNLRNLFRWHKKNFQKIALQFPLGSRAKVVSLTDDRFPTAHELWKLQVFAPHEVVLHNDFSVSHKPHTDRWRSLQQPKTPLATNVPAFMSFNSIFCFNFRNVLITIKHRLLFPRDIFQISLCCKI